MNPRYEVRSSFALLSCFFERVGCPDIVVSRQTVIQALTDIFRPFAFDISRKNEMLSEHPPDRGMTLGDNRTHPERGLRGVQNGVVCSRHRIIRITFPDQEFRRPERLCRPPPFLDNKVSIHRTVTPSRSTARWNG